MICPYINLQIYCAFVRLYYTMENVSSWVFYFRFDDVSHRILYTIGIYQEIRWPCHGTCEFSCGKLGKSSPIVAISYFYVFWLAVQRRRALTKMPDFLSLEIYDQFIFKILIPTHYKCVSLLFFRIFALQNFQWWMTEPPECIDLHRYTGPYVIWKQYKNKQ